MERCGGGKKMGLEHRERGENVVATLNRGKKNRNKIPGSLGDPEYDDELQSMRSRIEF